MNKASRIMNSFGKSPGERRPCYRTIRRFLRAMKRENEILAFAGLSFGEVIYGREQIKKDLSRLIRFRRKLLRDLNMTECN